MRSRISARIVLLGVLLCVASLNGAAQNAAPSDITAEVILKGLAEKQGEALHECITFLYNRSDQLKLTNREIDRVVDRLLAIRASDPYHKMVTGKGQMISSFPNREAAVPCIFRFRFLKIANSLRTLPMEQRVARIVDGIEHPPAGLGSETTTCFSEELVRAGKDAVPLIVQHKPEQAYHRMAVVDALARLGDPRAVDYVTEVLATKGDSYRFARPGAARALAQFKDQKAVRALIGALQDETWEAIDRHMPQVSSPRDKPYVGRYYSVQHAAAQSLTSLTGKEWGFLYNEDYQTWAAWLHSDHPETFAPAAVARTDRDVARLIELMFHRYMSGRPNPWQLQNTQNTPDAVRGLATELKDLGPRVVPVLEGQYQARVQETPLWKGELQEWTRRLLLGLDFPEATRAANRLADASREKQ